MRDEILIQMGANVRGENFIEERSRFYIVVRQYLTLKRATC